ncbi:hypothetical protein ASG92_12985 [Arthrobacter sp. Soil736]|nr:hypothetical protein ASG92_12985 [Arthrobacter sp. Soil736]
MDPCPACRLQIVGIESVRDEDSGAHTLSLTISPLVTELEHPAVVRDKLASGTTMTHAGPLSFAAKYFTPSLTASRRALSALTPE